jgi:hypothetical protein
VWDIADGVTGLRGNDTESKVRYTEGDYTIEAYSVNFTELPGGAPQGIWDNRSFREKLL